MLILLLLGHLFFLSIKGTTITSTSNLETISSSETNLYL